MLRNYVCFQFLPREHCLLHEVKIELKIQKGGSLVQIAGALLSDSEVWVQLIPVSLIVGINGFHPNQVLCQKGWGKGANLQWSRPLTRGGEREAKLLVAIDTCNNAEIKVIRRSYVVVECFYSVLREVVMYVFQISSEGSVISILPSCSSLRLVNGGQFHPRRNFKGVFRVSSFLFVIFCWDLCRKLFNPKDSF